jgi:hypothetical protein
MSDLVKRLRMPSIPTYRKDLDEAADEIERLRAELADSVAAEVNAAHCSRAAYEAAERAKAERDALREALGALGVIGGGYCFCSQDRDPDKAVHQPECRDARAALARGAR